MLIIPENLREHFEKVCDFADRNNLRDKLDKILMGLHIYGGDWISQNGWRVTLGYDWAPYSFSVAFEKRDQKPIRGGVIFHGEVKDGRVVGDGYWGIHT